MDSSPILSHYQADILLSALKKRCSQVEVSLDLGLTTETVTFEKQRVVFRQHYGVDLKKIKKIAKSENGCFLLGDNEISKIQKYSEMTHKIYSLMPTQSAPTMLISGLTMHRIVDANPYEDTLNKVKTIAPIRGRVLDTATGLGYTAIEAAKTATEVITIELDEAAQYIASMNPWSRRLFEDETITQLMGDSAEVLTDFDDLSFDCILHDPPAFSVAGHLYSQEYYQQLHRILVPGGKVFHYIGNPDSKSGAKVTRGVVKRLHDAGFVKVKAAPRAFGVTCRKG